MPNITIFRNLVQGTVQREYIHLQIVRFHAGHTVVMADMERFKKQILLRSRLGSGSPVYAGVIDEIAGPCPVRIEMHLADTGIGGGNGVERQLDIGINLVGPRIRRGKKVVKRRIGVRYQGGIFNIVQIAQKILAALVNQLLGTGENRAVEIAVHNLTGGCQQDYKYCAEKEQPQLPAQAGAEQRPQGYTHNWLLVFHKNLLRLFTLQCIIS